MERIDASGDERRILLDALVSYADACTLPKLTPSCPYYRLAGDAPTCQEQCRSLSVKYGGPDRPVAEATVGGLVLVGRQLPLGVASGGDGYDAGQRFIVERNLPLSEQSTGTLLLGLRAALRQPLVDDPSRYERTLLIWSTLESRGLDVESVVRGGMLLYLAVSIGSKAVAPALARDGELPSDMSSDFRELLAASAADGWPALLDAAVGDYPTIEAALQAGASRPHPYLRKLAEEDDELSAALGEDASLTFPLIPHLAVVASFQFMGRIEDWLSRLLEDGIEALVRADAPPKPVFDALPLGRSSDDFGLWIFERLTITRPDLWSTSTLLLEWRHIQGEQFAGIPPRIVAERQTDRQLVTDLALDRSARRHGRRAPLKDLSAGQFTESALRQLRRGNYQNAADIFEALTELRPADGDAINNLAFCRIPVDLESALAKLQEATRYPLTERGVNAANRALVLHLLRRNDDAEEVATNALNLYSDGPAILWSHEECAATEFQSVRTSIKEYLTQLVQHIMQIT